MDKAKLVEQFSQQACKPTFPGAAFSFTQPIIDNVTEAVTGRRPIWPSSSAARTWRSSARLAAQTLDSHPRGSGRGGHRHRAGGGPGAAPNSHRPPGSGALRHQRRDVQDVIEMAIGGRAGQHHVRRRAPVRHHGRGTCPKRAPMSAAIGNILVPTREGGRVPLSQLAEIQVVNGASIIARRENRRQITVRTNIRGRDQGSFVAEAQSAVRRGDQTARRIPRRLGRPVRESRARAASG